MIRQAESLAVSAECRRQFADGTTMPVIDYASAGKTGQEDSRMCAWIPMKR